MAHNCTGFIPFSGGSKEEIPWQKGGRGQLFTPRQPGSRVRKKPEKNYTIKAIAPVMGLIQEGLLSYDLINGLIH